MELPMSNGLSDQPTNSMQRAQAGNPGQQMHAKILADVRNGMAQLQGGWQAMLDPRERAARIVQLITMLRQLHQTENIHHCIHIAQTWELRTLQESPNREVYYASIEKKLREITIKRQLQANVQAGPGGMMQNNMINMQNMQNMQGMQGMQNNAMGNMGGMPTSLNMGMASGPMNGAQGQNQMFPAQLQRQMQPSPLPLQQQPSAATMDPAALQLPPQHTSQQSQLQQGQNTNQSNQAESSTMVQGGQLQPGQGAQAQAEMMAHARQLYDSMSDEQKNVVRANFMNKMNDQQRASLPKGVDPLLRYCQIRAATQFAQKQRMSAAVAQQAKTSAQNGTNANTQMASSGLTRPQSQTGGQNVDFNSILGQQTNALKMQESGEQVVPASNNNNNNNAGFGTQMNMPHNVNPAMLFNAGAQPQNSKQNGQGPNSTMNQNQMQFIMSAQRDAQQRERMQKQLMANQHALQQAQLRGQPGGLHTSNAFTGGANGQNNSPAMSMLNRPIAPTGQTAPGTPQPNRQQQTPSTPMANINQLSQHHQSMVQQNQQQQQQLNGQTGVTNIAQTPQFQALLQRVPVQFRQKLSQMPQDQMLSFIRRFQTSAPANRVPGAPGMQGMNMGAQQPGQQGQQPMMQPSLGAIAPGVTPQLPQQATSINSQDPTALQNQIRTQQQQRFKAQALDARPFPKPVLTQLSIAVPPHVQSWGDLKQHVSQNGPHGTLEKVAQQQNYWYTSHPQEVHMALQDFIQQQRARMQQNGQTGLQAQAGGQQPQIAMGLPPAPMPAPAAQMVPPAPQMQITNPGGPVGGVNQSKLPKLAAPGPQEIQSFRAKVPQAQSWTDEQIREIIIRNKLSRLQEQQRQQQQQMQAAQMQRSASQTNNGAQVNLQTPNQLQRTPQTASTQGSHIQTEQLTASAPNNEVIDMSGQAAKPPGPQAPAIQLNQSQMQTQPQISRQLPPRLTQEQLARMTDQQKQNYAQMVQKQAIQSAQMESIRKAQSQLGAPAQIEQGAVSNQARTPGFSLQRASSADAERLKQMNLEIVRNNPRGPPINLDKPQLERAKVMLKKLWKPLRQLYHTYPIALSYGLDDQKLKDIMKARHVVSQNVANDTGNLQGFLYVPPEQLMGIERTVANYMKELKFRRDQLDTAKQQGANGQNQVQAQATLAKTQQVSAASAGTAQHMHARKASASSKPPPAPVDNKPFDWAAPSPHGVPKYEPGRNELTADKLKFPPQKKRKTDQSNSQASTPAAQVSTPAALGTSPALSNNKLQSAEPVKKTQAQATAAQINIEAPQEVEQEKFKCKDGLCEASLHGFDTEDQLKQHEQSQHKHIDDPLAFLLENAAKALGVDQDGNPLPESTSTTAAKQLSATSLKPKVATIRDVKKEELTKLEIDQLKRGVTPASVKEKVAKKQVEFDAARREGLKDLTLREVMAQRLDLPPIPEDIGAAAAGTDQLIGPILEADMDAEGEWGESPLGGGIWGLRSSRTSSAYSSDPELTPTGSDSSGGSQSSDVSSSDAVKFCIFMENMDADIWGDGSRGGAPESLIPLYHRVKDMMKENEVANVAGEGESDADVTVKKRKAEDDWPAPIQDCLDEWFNQTGPLIGF